MDGPMKSGQYRRWTALTGERIGIVRLIAELTNRQSMTSLTTETWYAELVPEGTKLMLSVHQIGDEVPEMLVIAEAAQ